MKARLAWTRPAPARRAVASGRAARRTNTSSTPACRSRAWWPAPSPPPIHGAATPPADGSSTATAAASRPRASRWCIRRTMPPTRPTGRPTPSCRKATKSLTFMPRRCKGSFRLRRATCISSRGKGTRPTTSAVCTRSVSWSITASSGGTIRLARRISSSWWPASIT